MASQADEELTASVLEHDVAWRQAATNTPSDREEQYPDTLHSAYITSNAMYNLVDYAARKLGNDSTPGFDPVKNYGNNIAGLPAAYHGAILDATSQAEIDDIRASAVERRRASLRLEEAGLAGTAANLLAGVVDVDIALSALSDGSYLAAKMGVRTGFGMRVAQNATATRGRAMVPTRSRHWRATAP